jgi:AcrR family transcriptional regulator
MARRSQHSQEEIKDMVLKAAEMIVAEDGFTALKVREIAMEIGYTIGSIYMVFDNMADLIMQLKGRTLDDISQQLAQVPTHQTAQHQLVELAKTYLNFANQNFNRWSMIFEHRLSVGDPVPDWYQQKVDAIFQHIETLFKQLAPNAAPEQHQCAAHALWCGVHGVCILSLTGKLDVVGIKDVENSVVLLAESFIKGWIATYSSAQ